MLLFWTVVKICIKWRLGKLWGSRELKILDVPVDILRPEDLEIEILELLAKPGTKQIIFLSVWDLFKARRRGYQDCVNNADLIIPVSKSIIRGASFLKKEIPVRYNFFRSHKYSFGS